MPETRELKTEPEAIGDLEAKVADLEAKLTARTARQPTGTMQMTLAQTAPAKTLLLDGSTVSRTEYAALWKWVNDHNAAGFGDGDGSTTFTLPDMRDRVPVGAGNQYAPADTGGNDTLSLTTGQMPAHDHGGDTASADHTHDIFGVGAHSHSLPAKYSNAATHGHVNMPGTVAEGPSNSAGDAAGVWTRDNGQHDHGMSSERHWHNLSSEGSGDPVDVRQPYLAFNYLIWT